MLYKRHGITDFIVILQNYGEAFYYTLDGK